MCKHTALTILVQVNFTYTYIIHKVRVLFISLQQEETIGLAPLIAETLFRYTHAHTQTRTHPHKKSNDPVVQLGGMQSMTEVEFPLHELKNIWTKW